MYVECFVTLTDSVIITCVDIAAAADEVRTDLLTPDSGCNYDRVIEIDLDKVTDTV